VVNSGTSLSVSGVVLRASTLEGSRCVFAGGLRVALSGTVSTLVDISTSLSVSEVTSITGTLDARQEGCALSIGVTLSVESYIRCGTLIYGLTDSGLSVVIARLTTTETSTSINIDLISDANIGCGTSGGRERTARVHLGRSH
jgi:hypothetical protein